MKIKPLLSLFIGFMGFNFVSAEPATFDKAEKSPLAGEILCQDLTDPSDVPLSLIITKNLMSLDQYLAELSFTNGNDEEHQEWILIKAKNHIESSDHRMVFSTPKGSANPLLLSIDLTQNNRNRIFPAQLRYSLGNKSFARDLHCEMND